MHANLDVVQRQKIYGASWKNYIPLLVVVAVTLLSASAKQAAYGGWSWMTWVQEFMGFLMVVFSTFKLFDLEGYADVFQKYDLLARIFRPYAYLYPFIQLGLGLGNLSHWQPTAINAATVVVMVFGSLGVCRARFKDSISKTPAWARCRMFRSPHIPYSKMSAWR